MSQVSPAAAAGKDGGQFSPSHRTGSHKSSIELDAKSVVPGKGFRPATVRSAGKPKDQDATQAAPTEQSVVRTRWKQLLRTEGPKHMGRDKERNVAKELKVRAAKVWPQSPSIVRAQHGSAQRSQTRPGRGPRRSAPNDIALLPPGPLLAPASGAAPAHESADCVLAKTCRSLLLLEVVQVAELARDPLAHLFLR